MDYDAVVLAGGEGDRLGGADKATLEVGGFTLLERALASVWSATRTVVVGPVRATSRPVEWVRERAPGGGPSAALAAGMAIVEAPFVAVMAVDHPFVEPATFERLANSLEGAEAALALDDSGRLQPLLGLYRSEPLRRSLGRPDPGAPLMATVDRLVVVGVPGGLECFDIDTVADLQEARRIASGLHQPP